MAELDTLFVLLKEGGGSDLHLASGLPPRIRRKGKLQAVDGWAPLDEDRLRRMLQEISTEAQWRVFESTSDLDFAYGLPSVGRFRANFLQQHHGAGAVFRIIPEEILSLEKLNLPPAVEGLAELTQGMVLVTGPTGSGKSTTLAAVIDRINAASVRHIVTIEDPVEFVHTNKQSVFSHREVGDHTKSFSAAMRAALRQDPDVIVIGEMRDVETISLALAAAQMGVLVFGTLHTNSASKTIDRLIDAFPADEQPSARVTLSDALTAVVSQVLLPTADGKGRCAANEILLKTPGLPNLIRQGNTPMIASLIQSGKAIGMQAMDDALFELLRQERITPKAAYMKALNKARFEPMLQQQEPRN